MDNAALLLDRFLLALAVWREARGESSLGKLAVAWTIRNRVHDPRWPATYRDVILQAKQFSSFNATDPNATKFPVDDAAWTACVSAADDAMAGVGPATAANHWPATTANHYHARAVRPAWVDDSKIVADIGAHVFYRL